MNQNFVQDLDFLPFGEQLAGGSTTTHKFTGDERDSETSLDHTWFRQYSSQYGRWMTPDPGDLTAVTPYSPQTWNRYAYVSNNPLTYFDPWGLDPCDNDPNQCVSVTADPITFDPSGFSWGGGRVLIAPLQEGPPLLIFGGHRGGNSSWAWTFTKTFVSNFVSPSFYKQELQQGGCLNTFVHGTGNALIPSALPSVSTTAGAGTMAASAAMRYNAAQAYAASRTNVLGGQGLIFPQKSIPYNTILEGSAVTNLAEGGLGYVDGALFQGLMGEAEAAYNGNCH